MLKKPVLCLLAALSVAAAKTIVPPLDQKKIHAAYKEGEFDIVSKELENYSRLYKDRNWLRDDSVFLYKHLAVINTASPETREKGKYYMISMLRIMPSAEILDMYVSEEVDRIFLRTRQEFLTNMKMFGVDSTDMKIPTSPRAGKDGSNLAGRTDTAARPRKGGSAAAEEKSGSNWGWWTAGGLAVAAAAGAATYFAMQDDGEGEKINVIDVPSHK